MTLEEDYREKYRVEREKRLAARREVITNFTGDLAHYMDDPHTAPVQRGPLDDEVDAIVIGGGFGGILTAGTMKEAGLRRVRIIDGAGDFGGVWYWNRYPGAQCDVDSYCYLPMLEETGYMPREKYSFQPEIYAHAQRLARHFGLYDLALFQTMVNRMTWDEETGAWTVETDRGDTIKTRYIALCTGAFSNPKLPALPGLDKFKGHAFHTTRWDYRYTGGDSVSPLTDLADKTVAVLGTGATAVQVVPPLGRSAKKLYVFQRTPSTIGIRGNRPTDPQWVASLKPGWQRERIDNFSTLVTGGIDDKDLVNDGWTELYQALFSDPEFRTLPPDEAAQRREEADLIQMERIRARIAEIIKDPATAESLKPCYNYLCKRPCFHDQYLDTFNRPNVELVDTQGRGVEEIYDEGVVCNGVKYPVDCIVFATGFEGSGSYTDKVGIQITGRDGVTLGEHWAGGMQSLHGVLVSGFPNLFLNLGAGDMQAAVSVNLVHVLACTSAHIAGIVRETERRASDWFDLEEYAELEWVHLIEANSGTFRKFLEQCTPGRWNDEGHISERSPGSALYPGSAMDYLRLLDDWRERERFAGLKFFSTFDVTTTRAHFEISAPSDNAASGSAAAVASRGELA
jgi:cation diffusion facilitator CzcD-associated flavoprotein CzcO